MKKHRFVPSPLPSLGESVVGMRVLLGASVALAACGGSSNDGLGSGFVSGIVDNTTFAVTTAMGASTVVTPGPSCTQPIYLPDGGFIDSVCQPAPPPTRYVSVLLSNSHSLACNLLEYGTETNFASAAILTLQIQSDAAEGAPGTYAISPADGGTPPLATATYVLTDPTCLAYFTFEATSGAVTLTSATSTSLKGTYALTFGTEGNLTGTFDTGNCATAAVTPWSELATPPACQQ